MRLTTSASRVCDDRHGYAVDLDIDTVPPAEKNKSEAFLLAASCSSGVMIMFSP